MLDRYEPTLPAPREEPAIKRSPVIPRTPPVRGPRPQQRPRGQSLDRLFLNRRGELSWDQMTSFRGGQRRQGHRLIFWSWLALAIDGLILTSMSSCFLLTFAVLMKSPVGEVVRAAAQFGTGPLFAACFVLSSWIYLIVSRVFFGFSLGEWACDLRLGQPTQRVRSDYPLKVILRATLVLLTGIVTMPLLSLFTGRDVAGRVTGLQIVSLK